MVHTEMREQTDRGDDPTAQLAVRRDGKALVAGVAVSLADDSRLEKPDNVVAGCRLFPFLNVCPLY